MRLLPWLVTCFSFGAQCNIAAYEADHEFGRLVCTAASFLCYYCFFSSLLYRGE